MFASSTFPKSKRQFIRILYSLSGTLLIICFDLLFADVVILMK